MIFLITYRNYLEDVVVRKYADEAAATAEAKLTNPDPAVTALVVDTVSSLTDLGAKLMVDLYNLFLDEGDKPVTKFESRTVARQRFTTRLELRYGNLEVNQKEGPEMATKTNGKTKKVKKVKAERGPRELNRAAGAVSTFKQVREGTARQKILKLMSAGNKTPEQIAEAIGADRAKVIAHANCLLRDCGIGYKTDGGKIVALYPGNRTYDDAVKQAAVAE